MYIVQIELVTGLTRYYMVYKKEACEEMVCHAICREKKKCFKSKVYDTSCFKKILCLLENYVE